MSFASTIAELTQQQGRDSAAALNEQARIRAQALQSTAQAVGNAAAAKGQIWGNAISGIGQSIANIPNAINQSKTLDLQRQDIQAQVAERQAQAKKLQQQETENQLVDKAFESSKKPDGTIDEQAFLTQIPGRLQPVYGPMVHKITEFQDAEVEKKNTLAAHAFFAAYKGGSPDSLLTAAKMGADAKAITPDDLTKIQQLAGAISQAPQETQADSTKALAVHLGAHFPQFQDLLNTDKKNEAALAEQSAKAREANASAAMNEAKVAGTLPPSPDQQELITLRQKQLEEVNARLNGKVPISPKDTAELQIQRDRLNAEIKHWQNQAANEKLTKVEQTDPATGKTTVSYIPANQLAGKSFEKPTSATLGNRLASAQAVVQTGNDIVSKLSDPAIAKQVGPAMGRFNTVRDFIGNPPPELSELAAQIESYALGSMGVHGMRSVQGAKQISDLLDKHHTPESLAAAIKGFNSFSSHLLENEGRSVPATAPKTGTVGKYTYTVE